MHWPEIIGWFDTEWGKIVAVCAGILALYGVGAKVWVICRCFRDKFDKKVLKLLRDPKTWSVGAIGKNPLIYSRPNHVQEIAQMLHSWRWRVRQSLERLDGAGKARQGDGGWYAVQTDPGWPLP